MEQPRELTYQYELKDIEDEINDKVINIRVQSSRSLLSKINFDTKQKAREVIGLSVAVVLGFNIGDGNIRDKLLQGKFIMNVSKSDLLSCDV